MVQGEQKKARSVRGLLEEKRFLDVASAAETFEVSKSVARKRLNELEEQGLVTSAEADEGRKKLYFSAEQGFYEPEEVSELFPRKKKRSMIGMFHDSDRLSIDDISEEIGVHRNIVEAFLDYMAQHKLVSAKGSKYRLTDLAKTYGTSRNAIERLDDIAFDNRHELKEIREREGRKPLDSYLGMIERDVEEKKVSPIIVPASAEGFERTLFLSEICFGNQYLDPRFLKFVTDYAKKFPVERAILTGAVQGEFNWTQNKRRRELSGGDLEKLDNQLKAFHALLDKIKAPAIYVLGDDDAAVMEERAIAAGKRERRKHIHGIDETKLTVEEKRRMYTKDFDRRYKAHLDEIYPYMLRAGRDLMSQQEMHELGLEKDEYQILMEVIENLRAGREIRPEHKKIIDLSKLKDSEELAVVDVLHLLQGDLSLKMRHHFNFSDVTQYVNPFRGISERIRQQKSFHDGDLPNVYVSGHDEMFMGAYVHDVLAILLPGMKDVQNYAQDKLHTLNSDIKQSKTHKQVTIRAENATPGAIILEGGADNHFKIEILNNRVRKNIEESKGKPEESHVVALWSDLQLGSITERPEYWVKFMDYAVFTQGADTSIAVGDIIQGRNYRNMPNENEDLSRIRISSNVTLISNLIMPYIKAHHLKIFDITGGNHEDNSFYDELGMDYLQPIEERIKGYIEGCAESGTPRDLEVRLYRDIISPTGNAVFVKYLARELAGYKIGAQHQWARRGIKGSGGSPIDHMKLWAKGLGPDAKDVDIMVGAHYHSLWFGQFLDKVLINLAAFAEESGYEWERTYRSDVMGAILHLSNKKGITLELVSKEFLDKYKCVCPDYKDKDVKDYVRECGEKKVYQV